WTSAAGAWARASSSARRCSSVRSLLHHPQMSRKTPGITSTTKSPATPPPTTLREALAMNFSSALGNSMTFTSLWSLLVRTGGPDEQHFPAPEARTQRKKLERIDLKRLRVLNGRIAEGCRSSPWLADDTLVYFTASHESLPQGVQSQPGRAR